MKWNRSAVAREMTPKSSSDSWDEQRFVVARNSHRYKDTIAKRFAAGPCRRRTRPTVLAKWPLLQRRATEDFLAPNQSANFPTSDDREFEAKNWNISRKRSIVIRRSRHRRSRDKWRNEVFCEEDLVNALIGNKYRNCRRWVMTYINNMLASGRLLKVDEQGIAPTSFSSFDCYSFGDQRSLQFNDSCCRTLAIC